METHDKMSKTNSSREKMVTDFKSQNEGEFCHPHGRMPY
jgi:hypothetical protein